MRKKVISYVMSVMVIVLYFWLGHVQVMAAEIIRNQPSTVIEEAENYARKYYMEMVEIIADGMQEEMGIEISDLDNIWLGKPYYIYDVEAEFQNAEFYFPIYDENKVVLMLHVSFTDSGWKSSMDVEYTDVLNEMDYLNNECVFYSVGDATYVENTNEIVQIRGDICSRSKGWDETLSAKKMIVEDGKQDFAVIMTKQENCAEETIGAGGGSVSTSTGKYLSIGNYYTGQGNYELCWAASIATIYRYRTGTTSLTAKNVADTVNARYDVGAKDNVILIAFQKYDLSYLPLSKTPSWEMIKRNIEKEYPVALVGNKSTYGHMVLITGYNVPNENHYVKIWDPKDEVVQLSKYEDSSIRFQSNGTTYYSSNAFYRYK